MKANRPTVCSALLAALLVSCALAEDAVTLRFYQGVTAYVNNPSGKAFEVGLEVRDWNLLEQGPREVLLKIYDPDGRLLEREVIEDDGVAGPTYLPETGGWDHEMWYYALLYGRGSKPMIRWSSFTEPARLQTLQARTRTYSVSKGKKGLYQIMVVGSRDHVATMRLDPPLKYGLAGHPIWMHGHGPMFRRSYVYVPKGSLGMNMAFAEFDLPVTRHFTVAAPDGGKLWDQPASGGFKKTYLKFQDRAYDDKLLTVEVSPGDGDFMMHLQFTRSDMRPYRGMGGVPALYTADRKTAKALRGGAIYHDDAVFWHGYQVRLHDWLKTLKPEDFIVRDAKGNEIKPTQGKAYGWGARSLVYKGLPTRPGFIPLNGQHEAPPVSDSLMHSYPAHQSRGVLNLALRDLAKGLRPITVGDCPVSKFNGNFGYIFATYGWHYWRPAWRILQQSDAPQEIKDIVREAMILCGDRLAFGRGIERVNGNAFSHIPMALHYCAAATGDPLQRKLADTYFERFASEGWGRRTGISKSGDCQEHFAHDFHYGSYILANYRAIVNDLGLDKFKKVRDRIVELYSYLYCKDTNAYAWDARTHHGAGGDFISLSKAQPGPDFTVSVNGGDEWFAARRKSYYALTYHGRLAPTWLNNYFATRMGYGGGMLCQVSVPGRGTVIASTLNGSYGKNMQPEKWRTFHLHSVVGELADGRPLVAADSEHPNARLKGTTVTGSGEVRDRPVHVKRITTLGDSGLTCEVQLSDTELRAAYWGMGPSSKIREAYEMIPFIGSHRVTVTDEKGKSQTKTVATKVTALSTDGEDLGALGEEVVEAQTIVIDRGGYGARIELPSPMKVHRGEKATILIHLLEKPGKPDEVSLKYRIVPFAD